MITVADGSDIREYPYPRYRVLDHEREGFMMFNGQMREIREVHRTQNGIQIELYPRVITQYGFA